MKFTEESRHPVDPKGRVFLPKRFQAEIKAKDDGERVVVLTRGADGCLFLFTEESAEEAIRQLQPSAFATPARRQLQRLFFSYTAKLTLDAAGRLLLPERFRSLAGIGDEVVMVGMDRWIEIWAADRWDRFLTEHGDRFDELGALWQGGDVGDVDGHGDARAPEGGKGNGPSEREP